jgi:hypothetical protein
VHVLQTLPVLEGRSGISSSAVRYFSATTSTLIGAKAGADAPITATGHARVKQ